MADETNNTEVNIYCDESSVDNPNLKYMTIGSLWITRNKVREIRSKIKELQKKHYLNGELKWVKTSSKTIPFYTELFDMLFGYEGDVEFKCIVVDKEQIDYAKFHDQDKDLAFYKFYYFLLKNKLESNCLHYLFLDFKPSKNPKAVSRLADFLTFSATNRSDQCGLKHVQAYPSDENVLIQVADILTGAVAYSNNFEPSGAKGELSKVIASSIGKTNLKFCSSLSDKKFNIFCIDLKRK